MIFILLILFAVPGAAQSPARKQTQARKNSAPRPPESHPTSWPLVALAVKGNKTYTEQQVIRASGLKLGQTADEPAFEAARGQLMRTGAFELVGYQFGPDADGKGYSGTLTVQEVEQLFPYRFEDLPATDAELRDYLHRREPLFESKMPGTKEFLDRVAAEVKEFVEAKGFQDGVVARMTSGVPGELTVLFRPATARPNIGEIKFTGNEALPNSTLHNTFGLVAIGVPYSEKRVRELLESSIRPVYESKGRLKVAFPAVTAAKMEKVDGLSVTVSVVEGPAFKVGQVKAAGSSVPAKELLSVAKFKEGEVADFTAAQTAADRIHALLSRQGFLKSETRVERDVHDKDLTVDIVFKTNDGRRYEMGKLTIDGLDVTTEPAIRKLWSLAPGNPFNAEYPQMFLDRVREDGYLDNLGKTRFTQNVNDNSGTVDVTLYFAGSPPDPERRKRKSEY